MFGLLVAFAGFFQTELFFNEFRYVCFVIHRRTAQTLVKILQLEFVWWLRTSFFFCVCVRSWVQNTIVCVCFFSDLWDTCLSRRLSRTQRSAGTSPHFENLFVFFCIWETACCGRCVLCESETIGVLDSFLVCLNSDSREPPNVNCAALCP